MKKISRMSSLIPAYLCALSALFLWQGSLAAQSLVVSPITWPSVGLDSNNVDAGPNTFPIGQRVCASGGDVTNVKSKWVWTTPTNDPGPGTNIYLRPGTLPAYTFDGIDLANGECYDFYYEVEIRRHTDAYLKYRSYQISTWSDQGGTFESPAASGPVRQVGVEYLVSQSRNSVQGIDWGTDPNSLTELPVGDAMNLFVGNEYYIRLRAKTATNGYEQLEAFINFPNTIFQVLSATSTYTANTSPFVTNPSDKLYANGCNWDEDPTSPTYASCLGTGKAGGTITVTYRVRILSVPSAPLVNPEPLQTLIYDFSGSSFHYNSDFSQKWFSNILPAAQFSKNFSPNPITPGGTSTLTFTITNLTTSPLTDVSFDDTFPATTSVPPAPGDMLVAAAPNVTTTGCGISPPYAVSAGDPSVSFSGMTIGSLGTCTITVNVTAPTVGAYPNTSDFLYMNGGVTNLRASDTLIVLANTNDTCRGTSNAPITLATWTMPTTGTGSGGPPPPFTTKDADVPTAVATFNALNGGTSTINTTLGSAAVNSWSGVGQWYTAASGATNLTATVVDGSVPAVTPHFSSFQFAVNTTAYSSGTVTISFNYHFFSTQGQSGWSNGADNRIVVYSSTNGTTWTRIYDLANRTRDTWYSTGTLTAAATGTTTTYFRATFAGVNQQTDAAVAIDDVVIQGFCSNQPPSISKAFSPNPVAVGGTSALTFTVTNPTFNNALTGISFTDILPAGLTVATTGPTAACNGGSLTTTAPGTISFSGGSLAATAGAVTTCTITVPVVTATVPGPFLNESSPFVTATPSGPNTDPTCGQGIACATLDTIVPPTIAKLFSPAVILSGGTSVLSFRIDNPTLSPMSGVGFSDTYPAGITSTAVPPTGVVSNCGGSITGTSGSLTLTGASIPANSFCTISLTVTSTTLGTHVNTTTPVYRTVGGTEYYGNTASADLTVRGVEIEILKQIGPTADGPWYSSLAVPVGTPVFFRFTIENTGEVPITQASISDTLSTSPPALNMGTCPAVLAGVTPGTPLPVFGTLTCVSGSYTVNVAGDNRATASTTTGSGDTSDESIASFSTTALTLDKSTTTLSYSQVGDVISYSYLVTNTGTTELAGLVVFDDRDLNPPGVSCPDTTLSPSESVTCTATYTVTDDDIKNGNFVTNVARALAGGVYSNFDSTTVPGPPYNYGGLPVPYDEIPGPDPSYFPELVTNIFPSGGARNLTCGVYLGASVESNTTGGPSSDPAPDGAFYPAPTWNGIVPEPDYLWVTQGRLRVTVTGCPGTCYLNGWINFQMNGDFSSPGNQVFDNVPVVNGLNTLTFNMPPGFDPVDVVLGDIWYARFRLTEASVAAASPTGGGGCGEVEDYGFWALDLTTPVTLAFFQATGQGNATRFSWSTAAEVANVGFDLYAVSSDGETLEKLTAEPVRSTAVGPSEPQSYEFEASAGSAKLFYLEDIDTRGLRKMHGPFAFGRPYGKRPNPARTDWAKLRREREKQGKKQTDAAQADMASGRRPLAVNLLASADGIYRITYETLKAAGFDFGKVNPQDLAVVNRGTPVPIEVTGAGSRFGAGSAIQFWATGLKSLYTRENVYTLVADRKLAARVAVDSTMPGLSAAESYLETVRVEKAQEYDIASPAEDPWLDRTMFTYRSARTTSFPITLDTVASTTGASLSVSYYGITDWPASPDHRVVVRLNDSTLSDDVFDGPLNRTVNVSVPPGLIREGANTMTVVLPGDTGVAWDMVGLKRYSVTYPRRFLARNGRLTFTATGSAFRVEGLTSPNALVYRLSGSTIVRLAGAQVESTGGAYAVRFPGSRQEATYVVATVETALSAGLSVPANPSGLLAGPAQFLIVSHPDFIGGLAPLVSARQAQGLTVKVVDVNDVYGTYSHGIFDPLAIKRYIADAAAGMGTQFVLLVGGDTYDYRNDLGLGAIGFIPTLYGRTDSLVTFAPIDPLYGDLDGDNLPEVAIGRFPVRTADELDSVIRKTLAYDRKDYGRTAVFAADAEDGLTSFKAINEAFVGSLPTGWDARQANIDDDGLASARTRLLDGMNAGAALVNFVGHSSLSIWTFDPLLDYDDAVALRNFGRPLFVSQFGCWNTYFVSPYYDTLGHALMLSGDQGAAGVMGASTLTQVRSDKALGQFLIPAATVPGKRIGTAINEAKRAAAAQKRGINDVVLGWVLLGDPTLVIER